MSRLLVCVELRRARWAHSVEALVPDFHKLPAEAPLDAKMAVRDGMIERRGDANNVAVLFVNRERTTDTAIGADGVRA